MDPDADVRLTVRTIDGREYAMEGSPRLVRRFLLLGDPRTHSMSSPTFDSEGNKTGREVLIPRAAIAAIAAPEGFWTVAL